MDDCWIVGLDGWMDGCLLGQGHCDSMSIGADVVLCRVASASKTVNFIS